MARSDWKRPESFKALAEGERRIALTLSYDGSYYHGWQRQDGCITVQQEIERVLRHVTKEEIVIYGSGRTDSGVHALMQVAHFDTFSNIEAPKFRIILNTMLPHSIRCSESVEKDSGFHARFSTQSREYWYLVKDIGTVTAFDEKRVLPVKRMPDIRRLNEYASVLFGTHDFTTFSSSRDKSTSKMRDIYLSSWDVIFDTFSSPVLRYRVAANAFLYNQVRSMTGSMLEAERLGLDKSDFASMLEKKDRSLAYKTASPCALYLANISYDRQKYEWFENL